MVTKRVTTGRQQLGLRVGSRAWLHIYIGIGDIWQCLGTWRETQLKVYHPGVRGWSASMQAGQKEDDQAHADLEKHTDICGPSESRPATRFLHLNTSVALIENRTNDPRLHWSWAEGAGGGTTATVRRPNATRLRKSPAPFLICMRPMHIRTLNHHP